MPSPFLVSKNPQYLFLLLQEPWLNWNVAAVHIGDIGAGHESSGKRFVCEEGISVTREIIEGRALYRAVDKSAYRPAREPLRDVSLAWMVLWVLSGLLLRTIGSTL